MSHSLVVVIVDPKNTDTESEVDKILAPFDENLEVEPYPRKCYCVGRKAERRASDEMQRKLGTWDEAREQFRIKGETSDEVWQKEYYKPRNEMELQILSELPDKDFPDAECEECKGTGAYKSTRNPQSKWDWYRIGGRWDGVLQSLPDLAGSDGFNVGDKYTDVKRNSCKVTEIKMEYPPFASVTPDGVWHEKGDMGWWCMVSDEKPKDAWVEEWNNITRLYPDYLAVAVDVHI